MEKYYLLISELQVMISDEMRTISHMKSIAGKKPQKYQEFLQLEQKFLQTERISFLIKQCVDRVDKTGKPNTFETAFQLWKKHREITVHQSDICECQYSWNCPTCKKTVNAIGEDIPAYFDMEKPGNCQTCEFA